MVRLVGWCTSVSELNDLCGIWGRGGEGRRRGFTTTSCWTQRESHLYYVMTVGTLHPLLLFFSFPGSPTHSFSFFSLFCFSFTAVCFWFGITDTPLPRFLFAMLHACNRNVTQHWISSSVFVFFFKTKPLNQFTHGYTFFIHLSAFHLVSVYKSLCLPLITVHLQLLMDSSLSALACLIWCSPSLL